jgi:hypothetical protein
LPGSDLTNQKTIARPPQIPAFSERRNSAPVISRERGELTHSFPTLQNEMRAFQS